MLRLKILYWVSGSFDLQDRADTALVNDMNIPIHLQARSVIARTAVRQAISWSPSGCRSPQRSGGVKIESVTLCIVDISGDEKCPSTSLHLPKCSDPLENT